MQKKKNHLKPATILKNYWRDNEQFADLFNAVLFNGEQVIMPEELEDEDTDESIITEHRTSSKTIEAFRDNIKIQKVSSANGIQFVLLGLEHQEHIHYAMPMRIMGYDYSSYKKQYDNHAKNYKTSQGMDEDEYLSRMRRTDKLMPVVTILIYYGEKPWDGALSLHGMLDIPERLSQYINDYKMLLVEVRKNNLKLHNINNMDLFNMLEILIGEGKPLLETKEKAIMYAKQHKVQQSVVMAVASAANCKIDFGLLEQEGASGMWTVFEETRKEGMIKGKAEGKAEGKVEGKTEMILAMLEAGYPYGEIAKIANMPEYEVKQIEKNSMAVK